MLSTTKRLSASLPLSANEQPPVQYQGMDLPSLIRFERARKGWSQRALARILGVSHGLVAQWENGATKPSHDKVADLLGVFGISHKSLSEPGSPFTGQYVTDVQELLLLTLWRRLEPDDQSALLRLIRRSSPAAPLDGAKPRVKGNDVPDG